MVAHYSFHLTTSLAYKAVHDWLESNVNDAKGYTSITYEESKLALQKTDWKHVACQYYTFFPSHYFKVVYLLNDVIGEENLLAWLQHQQKFCLLDVGCGGGAASAAFIDVVVRLKEQGKIKHNPDILLIGIDPSVHAVGLYIQTMLNLKLLTSNLINMNFKVIIDEFPSAYSYIERHLKEVLTGSKIPCFSNALVVQLNVISPFSQAYKNRQEKFNKLRSLNIDIDSFHIDEDLGLGTTEGQAYKQLIENASIDVMHVATIGTKNMELQFQQDANSQISLKQRIQEMSATLSKILESRHTVVRVNSADHIVKYENPKYSYWHKNGNNSYSSKFFIDFQSIYSANYKEDKEWKEITSIDNLRLAWARARNSLLRETLHDEIEIRLFEINLEVRLEELRKQLLAYINDVVFLDDAITYKFPKNQSAFRPRALSRIEEEILSIAVIQKLGNKASQLRGNSYAYRITQGYGENCTEFLYEYWFNAYCYYMKKARDSAMRYPNGMILRVDIESFYTNIIQDQLCNELSRELTVSERVRWLVRLLISKNLDDHELGKGITQGNIGSGFYANVYLTPLDSRFGSANEWGVEFHRYVDDMILVIPNPKDLDVIEEILKDELHKLGLSLNLSKTEKVDDVSIFLKQTDEDELIEQLGEKFESIINALWILNLEHRTIFNDSFSRDDQWWHNLQRYCQCLKAIRVYIHESEASRKIYKYIFSIQNRDQDLLKQKEVLKLERELQSTRPPSDDSFDSIFQWATNFSSANNLWMEHKCKLHAELRSLFLISWKTLKDLDVVSASTKNKLYRNIRFSLYRLSILGFDGIIDELTEMLRESFWILRDPVAILENLARQGYGAEIKNLFGYYQSLEENVDFLKASVIRAMRLLPTLDAQELEVIVECATMINSSVSIAEMLMATETWLCIGKKYNSFKQSHHIEAVKEALYSHPNLPNRLIKNYLLILGQFAPNVLQDISVDESDPMLVVAKEMAIKGNPSEIFYLPEPKIIRENYYSGKRTKLGEESVIQHY